MMFCGNCGKEVQPGKKFCAYCGAPLETPPPPFAPPAYFVPMPKKKSHKPAVVAIALAVIVVLGAAGFFSLGSVGTILTMPSGAKTYKVLSPSMEPAFKVNDSVVAVPVDPSQINIGDIIVFKVGTTGNTYLAHRVVKIEQSISGSSEQGPFFITQGDANAAPDPPITGDCIVGRVVRVAHGFFTTPVSAAAFAAPVDSGS